MALVIKDRVKETTTVTGTGTATLLGASAGYSSFSTIGNGNTTFYCIADQTGNNWEVGIGTYTLSGTTLSRDTVLANSLNTTALISFTSGTKDVFCTYPAEKSVNQDASGNVTVSNVLTGAEVVASNGIVVNNKTVGTSYSIPSGYSAMSAGPITVNNGISVTVPNGSRWVIV